MIGRRRRMVCPTTVTTRPSSSGTQITATTDFAGIPIELQFNDKPKARGFIEGFLRGMGVDVSAGARYDGQFRSWQEKSRHLLRMRRTTVVSSTAATTSTVWIVRAG